MITHVHSATIVVADQDEALRFYVDTLGWEKRDDNRMGEMRWLVVAPPGATTALVLGQPDIHHRQPPGPDEPQNCDISLVTDDIAATYAELTAKGVRFSQPPETMPWGARATWFSDPSGNQFFLAEEAG
jgi:predicted enzyme related to lactoylglutathione lyase